MPPKKITRIESQRRRPDRKTIILDDGSVFGIPGDVFLTVNLHVGDELDDTAMQRLLDKSDRQRLINAALNLLSYRARSRGELRQRLLEKGNIGEEVEQVLDYLEERGYLDDLEFARMFARDKVKFKLLGPVALRNELHKKWVDKNIIDQVIAEIYEDYSARALLSELIDKKIDLNKPDNDPNARKLINFLQRKGFRWPDIQAELVRRKLL